MIKALYDYRSSVLTRLEQINKLEVICEDYRQQCL